MKNKRAEKYLTPFNFIVWGLIGVAVVGAVLIFYSAKIDIREDETEILATRLADCFIENGYIQKISKENVFEKCGLNEEIFKEESNFYFIISIDGLEDFPIQKGNSNLAFQCGLEAKNEEFARCEKREVYALNEENKKLAVEIFTASNQEA